MEFSKRLDASYELVVDRQSTGVYAAEAAAQAESALRDAFFALREVDASKAIKQARRVLRELNELQDMIDRL